MKSKFFNHADVTPHDVLAGDSVEFCIKLVLGQDFTVKMSRIILDMPAYIGYSRPTCIHQEMDGYTEVFCSNPGVTYTKRVWDVELGDFESTDKASFKRMAQRFFILDLTDGNAIEGDEILIKWGYTCNGYGCGTKVTNIVLSQEFYNTIHVRYFKDGTKGLPDYGRSFKGYIRPVPDVEIPLSFRVLPREPEKVRLIHHKGKASLLVQDRFSNICSVDKIKKLIPADVEQEWNSFGVCNIKMPFIKIEQKELDIYETPEMDNVYEGMNVYFGDLHVHSAWSNDCIEREKQEMTPELLLKHARDVSCLDFMAVTDHHISSRPERKKIGMEKWALLNETVEKYNREGDIVAFSGLEFSCERGDTAVVFNEVFDYNDIDKPAIRNIKDLWNSYRGRDYITIPHFHNSGSLQDGIWYDCPYEGIENNLEIFSCHGSYENEEVLERHIPLMKSFRRDRNGKYFLKNGYHYGFICNSDGHKGHTGQNGLTAVYARGLAPNAIIEAIRKRQVYGTTNARIRLLFTINGELMGSVLPIETEKRIHIDIKGERPLKYVSLMKNGELYKMFCPESNAFSIDMRIDCEDPSNWYVRAVQTDNHIAWSSPIWFE